MFGVVPRVLWQQHHPPDESNRIPMVTRCLLARGEGRVVVIDTGMGGLWSAKERDIYALEDGDRSIARRLAARGIAPEEVTDVVFTHLHFDHAGGAVAERGGRLEPAFPRARHHVQRRQLEWAMSPTEKDRRSFRPENFMPLREAGVLSLADGDEEVAPGICVEPAHGHTPGHQIVRIGDGDETIVYCGDLIPTVAHLPAAWVMAYDVQPLTTLEEKRALLARAAGRNEMLVLDHDPGCKAVRVARQGDGFVVAAVVAI